LELDIGFLHNVCFLYAIGSAHEHRHRASRRSFGRGSDETQTRGCALAAAIGAASGRFGIWYARDEVVKPGYRLEVPKTLAT
jgi:hypothetical protein